MYVKCPLFFLLLIIYRDILGGTCIWEKSLHVCRWPTPHRAAMNRRKKHLFSLSVNKVRVG